MKVLVIGPPLYGLLYPIASLAQAFRVSGHDTVVASAGAFARRISRAGLVAFDAAPELDSEAEYRRREAERTRQNLGTKPGGWAFFSEEMADALVDFTDTWRPDLIVYPPLGVVARLLGAKFDVPTVMHTIGFAHRQQHLDAVTGALSAAFTRHGVGEPRADLRWLDVAPPSMSILPHPPQHTLPMRYVPYNGGAVIQDWWHRADTAPPRILVSLGTLKPMVDGLDLIDWVVRRADEIDAEFVLQLGHNARAGLSGELPANVRLVDWIPMGGLVDGADLVIHHGGAGNTLTALAAGVPQIAFGQGADRPTNARVLAERGCGVVPGDDGLSGELIERTAKDPALRAAAAEVRAEIAAMPSPAAVAAVLADLVAGV